MTSNENNFGANIAGYLNFQNGLGQAVRGCIGSFESAGIPYSLTDVDRSLHRLKETPFNRRSMTFSRYNVNCIYVNADVLDVFVNLVGREYLDNKYNIGYWLWELSDFHDSWAENSQYLNEIWTASSFCRDSIIEKTNIPTHVMPLAVHIKQEECNLPRKYFRLPDNRFIFISSFDFQSIMERKNPLQTIECFRNAFPDNKTVVLLLKCINPQDNIEEYLKLTNISREDPRIMVFGKQLNRPEMYSLLNCSDCFISLHRGEGFGLQIAESMFLGKPVIATDYSGNTDFMDETNSFPVRYELVTIEKTYGPYLKGMKWAQPDLEHAASLMKYIYENHQRTKDKGRLASESIRNNLSYMAVGSDLNTRLRQVY